MTVLLEVAEMIPLLVLTFFSNYIISPGGGCKNQSEQYFTRSHNASDGGKLGADGIDTVFLDVEFFDFQDKKSVPRAQLNSSSKANDGKIIVGTDSADKNLTGTTGNDIVQVIHGDDNVFGSTSNNTIDANPGIDFTLKAPG